MVASALSMVGLAMLWHRVLTAFDRTWPFRKVAAWYFAGELGKYIPGGIWPVVGRGELARRDGVKRSTAYATTLLSLALMCVGAAFACGLLAPFLALDGGGIGPEMAAADPDPDRPDLRQPEGLPADVRAAGQVHQGPGRPDAALLGPDGRADG